MPIRHHSPYLGGSSTVLLVYNFTGLDSEALLHTNNNIFSCKVVKPETSHTVILLSLQSKRVFSEPSVLTASEARRSTVIAPQLLVISATANTTTFNPNDWLCKTQTDFKSISLSIPLPLFYLV